MRYANKKYTIWGFGLSQNQADTVGGFAGSMYRLRTWDNEFPDFSHQDMEPPCLICFSLERARAFAALPRMETAHLEMIPKTLLLHEGYSLQEVEEALDLGCGVVLRPPFTAERLDPVLRRATETAALHKDILNMTREISLERELLENKNETLDFLVNFLTSTTEQLDEKEVLRTAYASLGKLFPVQSLNAVLTHENDEGSIDTELYIAAPKDHVQYLAWRSLLLEAASAQNPGKTLMPSSMSLQLPGLDKLAPSPADGHTFTLPLVAGTEKIGCVILLTNMNRNLNRDQGLALDSAMRHLGLTLKNVQRFQQMCHYADYDSLTGTHNRRNFEERLIDEVRRHSRYKLPLSLVMLDLDHFKKVNDTWGHIAGDRVLQSAARVIEKTIRGSDYCARYGGEEFVIILPHTDKESATLLAERLRTAMAAQQQEVGSARFSISCSLGVACLDEAGEGSPHALISDADAALYEAKAGGRNKVVCNTKGAENPMAHAAHG
ncbi:GGDEF domain-containing protein [Desulfovibrio sp. OttesenSCG-928-I05]|nr:GGDEF domain-containing protein [Desulfovibrio sp. OttesenSCG-928-I05]